MAISQANLGWPVQHPDSPSPHIFNPDPILSISTMAQFHLIFPEIFSWNYSRKSWPCI